MGEPSWTLVPDVFSLNLKNDILGKILRMGADTLQGLDSQHRVDRETDVSGILHDISH
jgi:hypothetical protein